MLSQVVPTNNLQVDSTALKNQRNPDIKMQKKPQTNVQQKLVLSFKEEKAGDLSSWDFGLS